MKKVSKVSRLAHFRANVLPAARTAGRAIAEAGPLYDELWNELAVLISTVDIDLESRSKIINLMDRLYAIRLEHLKAEKTFRDAAGLTISEAPEIVLGVKRIRAGKKTGKKKQATAATRHSQLIDAAKALLASGNQSHEVTGILEERNPESAKTIRTVLQDAGLVPRRKKREMS